MHAYFDTINPFLRMPCVDVLVTCTEYVYYFSIVGNGLPLIRPTVREHLYDDILCS